MADDPTGTLVAPEPQPAVERRPGLRVAISGAGGLIGSALVATFQAAGQQVRRLTRRESADPSEIFWDPVGERIESAKLEGLDAVIHLAGENIASGRWNERRKAAILDSRVRGTRLIATTLAALRRPPRVLLNASAIGYYGDRGDEPLDETSPPGTGFLAESCQAWEAAADPALRAGLRVCKLRIGVVLSREGGALAKMLPAFRWGLGGRLGSGRQYMSWIALDDVVEAFRFVLFNPTLEGAFNAVAPGPVTNAEFTRALGRVLRRPTLLPVPAMAIRLLLGEMGRELLLAGARIRPLRLERAGFGFRNPELADALQRILGAA